MPHSVILHKRTTATGRTPEVEALSAGELAVNIADGKIFIKTVDSTIKSFINTEQVPYLLNQGLSSVNFQYGNNSVTGALSEVLGGVENDITGWGSTVVNGSDNDIDSDYAFIGNGSNNKILLSGDYGAIVGGQNNTLNHQESFILGSNITSHLSGFTYVNNLTAVGKLYGDGSQLTGIIAGDTEATTLVRTNSASWGTGGVAQNIAFDESTNELSLTLGNTVSLSSLAGAGGDPEATTLVRSNSANWDSSYTLIQSNSANWQTTFEASSAYVISNPTGVTEASALKNLLQITQAGYNAITPATDTLYIIVG
jgi:hypothetical protein